jgi:protein-S-isoprenylcysteine O-methyltransferase Ste14
MQHPPTEVNEGTGWVGVVALIACVASASLLGLDRTGAVLLIFAGTASAMVLWTLLVEKSYLRDSTGLVRRAVITPSQAIAITGTKVIGFYATLIIIGAAYLWFPPYKSAQYGFYFSILMIIAPAIALFAPIYIYIVSRHMLQPRDSLWHFGRFIICPHDDIDREQVRDYVRAWIIKGFFLAFMISIFPQNAIAVIENVAHFEERFRASPVFVVFFCVHALILIDVCIGAIGYVFTFRPLDTHIRSANPYLGAWVAALICYPPFIFTRSGGPLDYHRGTLEWHQWMADMPLLLCVWGLAIVLLFFFYVWSTTIFGLRFSNLTNRGIITGGPYRYCKHPAYVAKNIAWWFIHIPFLTTTSSGDAVANVALLLLVNATYYWRAKTEEAHLMSDPKYVAYSEWIAANSAWARICRRFYLGGARSPN